MNTSLPREGEATQREDKSGDSAAYAGRTTDVPLIILEKRNDERRPLAC